MARLTKEERDALRSRNEDHRIFGDITKRETIRMLLDSLDAADEEIESLRSKVLAEGREIARLTQENEGLYAVNEELDSDCQRSAQTALTRLTVIDLQREEIARLTDAFAECDRRAKEAEEALVAMRVENKRLKRIIAKLMSEAETSAECIDAEFGVNRKAPQLIAENAMGEGYYEAKRLLEGGGGAI